MVVMMMMMMMTVVAFTLVVMVVVVVVALIIVVGFINVTFSTRFITFIFVLGLVGLGLIGRAIRSGYRNVRSTTGSRIRAASSPSHSHSGMSGRGGLGRCAPDQSPVKRGGNSVGRGSAEGDSSKDYRSLGSDHFMIRLEGVIECEG